MISDCKMVIGTFSRYTKAAIDCTQCTKCIFKKISRNVKIAKRWNFYIIDFSKLSDILSDHRVVESEPVEGGTQLTLGGVL